MDGIPPALLTGGGLTGILTLLVVALLKGWVIVGSVVDRLIVDKDAQIEKLWQSNAKLEDSVQKLTATGDLSVQLLRSLEQQATQRRSGGE